MTLVYSTFFFSVIAGVVQIDTLAPFVFIVALDHIMRTAIQNKKFGFTEEGVGKRNLEKSSQIRISQMTLH